MDTVKKYLKYLICLVLLISSVFTFYKVEAASGIILTFTDNSIQETVSGSGYIINGTSLEITKAGTYRIKGSCSDGNIEVRKGTRNVVLILDNLYLASTKTAPIVVKKDGASATIKVVGTTTLIDNENPEDEFSPDSAVADAYEGAAIKVKTDSSLTFEGTGNLTIIGNAKNGIKGGQGSTITINSGVININAANNGLACDNQIIINNGIIDITAQNEGIKLEPNLDDTDSIAELNINGGKLVVNAGQDGIQAIGDININGWSNIEITSGEDGIQTRSNFNMTNGNLTIHTYEGSDATTFDKDTMSAKGIKAAKVDEFEENATNTIIITGGTIDIDSSDDGLHADGSIYITRGTINIASGDDGIHSDTILVIGSDNGLERDPEINVNESIEGIESGNIYVYSGKIKIIALDDGMNAAGGSSHGSSKSHGEHFNPDTGQMEDNFALYIYGGSIYVNSEGDGLDANGSIYLYGGTHIIYHQDAQGNNSALDRDAKLVIDGATVFAAGGVADNGEIDSTGSTQGIVISTADYSANSKVAISDGGNVIFNDQIPKRSTYTFYSSPDMTGTETVTAISDLIDVGNNPWTHEFDEGVITTPATENNPGVITYSCVHNNNIKERKTYFYRGVIEFNFINKTNSQAAVTVGSTTNVGNFTTDDVDEYIYITSDQEIELIGTLDGETYEELIGEPTGNANEFRYHVDPSTSKTFYVVLNGDINMDGVATVDDSWLIAYSLLSTTNPLYRELSPIEAIIADENDNGIINSHDGLSIVKELDNDNVYDSSIFALTQAEPVILDGENDATVTINYITKQAIAIDSIDGNYYPNEDYPSSNGYVQLTNIEGAFVTTYGIIDAKNGFAAGIDTSETGLVFPADTVLTTLTYKIDKNTPTGVYPVTLQIGSVSAHGSRKESTFTLKSDIIVKGTTDPVTAFFSTDEGVASVDTYYTQDYSHPNETNVSSTTVRDKDTGELYNPEADPNKEKGQVNFTVNLKPGYVISSITATPKTNYKNLKGPADTEHAGTYRLTKVTGDVEIVITTKVATEYTAEFNKDNHITSIDVYHTQDYTAPDELNVSETYARNSDTGDVDISGDGQINFRVNVEPGYRIDTVTVSGNYKNLKEQEDGIYRVTKVSGDLIISVTSKKRTEIDPIISGIEEGYTYTGSAIKPEPSVITTAKGQDPDTGELIDIEIPLVKGKDYKLSYGDNINVGTDAGSVTISSLIGSQFIFDPITVYFNITKYTLTENNVNYPASIVYTGEALTPTVTVSANGKTLVSGTDYDIYYSNQDGVVGESVTISIVGKGNYKGTVDNINVYITDKASQILEFDKDEITKTYGENFTMTATLVEGDGTIRYTSNNTQAAIVDENTGEVTLIGTGQATIRAYASETANYAETMTSYKLIVKKATLTIADVTVSDKQYDENNIATVTDVVFDGLVYGEELVPNVDYTVVGTFSDSNVGDDKPVTVTVELSTETIKRYSLSTSSYETTASIIPLGIDSSGVALSETEFTYTGSTIEPTVTVVVNGETLVENTDYKVSYVNNVDAGLAYAVVVGINNYSRNAPVSKEFTINKKTITPSIDHIEDVTYDGTAKTPSIVVKDGNTELVVNKDYTVSYSNNINSGIANVLITKLDSGNYEFDDSLSNCEATFEIKPYKLKDKNISLDSYFVNYDGNEKEPVVTVTYNGMTLVQGVDYAVSYTNNINVTESAKVTVTAISSNYTGTPSVYFEISDKQELYIIATDNQSVTYTGSPVVLANVSVSHNNDGITADDLTIKYYDLDDNEIDRPTNAGKYYVIYSFDGTNYKGSKKVEFEITKANSDNPSELTANLVGAEGDPLSSLPITSEGLNFVDPTLAIIDGNHAYEATYTQNNDTNNYNPITVYIPVYGKSRTTINTSVDGTGGTITPTIENVVEGEHFEIAFTPLEGYEVDRVLVDNTDVPFENNKIIVTGGTEDTNVIVSFKTITYNMNISGQEVTLDEDGIIEVEYKSHKKVIITPKPGYKLTSVLVNDSERITDVSGDSITINNVTEDTDVIAKAERISYEVVEGARQEYIINKHISARFKINAEYNLFENGGKVYVDDELVDPRNYTSKEGSTIITFNRDYMDQLDLGAHTLRVEFNDGGNASCIFRVALLKYTDAKKNDNPKTYDNIVIFIMGLVLSSIGILIIILKAKVKREMS